MGQWQELKVPWYETSVSNCALCGQVIPRRAWVAERAGERRFFCGPACERLFRDYWLPRYGSDGAADPGRASGERPERG